MSEKKEVDLLAMKVSYQETVEKLKEDMANAQATIQQGKTTGDLELVVIGLYNYALFEGQSLTLMAVIGELEGNIPETTLQNVSSKGLVTFASARDIILEMKQEKS